RQIGAADFAKLVASLKEAYESALVNAPEPTRKGPASLDIPALVNELRESGDVSGLRDLLGSAVQAVLVSPAASRAHNAPTGDRVRVVWNDEPALALPKRGRRFE